MNNKIRLFLLGVVLFFSCVPERIYSIKIYNYSHYNVNVFVGLPESKVIYPDTLLPEYKPNLYSIEPNGYNLISRRIKWEGIIKSLPNDTLSLYVLSGDSLDKYSWEKIRKDYNILKRFDLSLQDLQSRNWSITYPD